MSTYKNHSIEASKEFHKTLGYVYVGYCDGKAVVNALNEDSCIDRLKNYVDKL